MASITKREFEILDLSGQKYLEWRVDALTSLKANGLERTIEAENYTTPQEKAKAIVFLRHHIHESLKTEYMFVDDPVELWESLNERYGHQNEILYPQARHEWNNIRFQDFKSITEYNSVIHRITSQLRLCGHMVTQQEMLEKTFSTMHASNVLLQQQYRERGFERYSDLLKVLLVAEKNNELLMKNHNLRPTGSTIVPEANAIEKAFYDGNTHQRGQQSRFYNGRGRNRGRGRGRGRNSFVRGRGQGYNKPYDRMNNGYKGNGKQKVQTGPSGSSQKPKSICYRCGMADHWSKVCRTAPHLVKLYQADKNKEKATETNYIENGDVNKSPVTSLDVNDFLNLDNNDEFALGV